MLIRRRISRFRFNGDSHRRRMRDWITTQLALQSPFHFIRNSLGVFLNSFAMS